MAPAAAAPLAPGAVARSVGRTRERGSTREKEKRKESGRRSWSGAIYLICRILKRSRGSGREAREKLMRSRRSCHRRESASKDLDR